jgi:hypothetical protein
MSRPTPRQATRRRRKPGLRRRTPLARSTPLRPGPWRKPGRPPAAAMRAPLAASNPQRAKIVGGACIVCLQTKGITPAHLAPRSLGGCDEPDCVVPLCWMHHRAYDTGRLDLLAHLEPAWRTEIAHAVSHLSLIGALRRLSPRPAISPPTDAA